MQINYKNKDENYERNLESLKSSFFGKDNSCAYLSKVDVEISNQIYSFMENPYRFLVIIGPPGCGKSYICAALIDWILLRFNFRRFYRESDLLNRVRQSIQVGYGEFGSTVIELVDDDMVVIDDVAASTDISSNKDYSFRKEVFFRIVEHRFFNNLPTIFTSNLTATEFSEFFNPRTASRLFADKNVIVDMFQSYRDYRIKNPVYENLTNRRNV